MTKTKTFSEMITGDIRWMKQQEAVNRMRRLGKTEMVLLDVEAGGRQFRPTDFYDADEYMARILLGDLKASQGFGKGMHTKRKMVATREVVAEINGRHPACAAELAHGGERDEYSFNFKTSRMRDWQKVNWAYYYGMGNQWKVASERI